MLTVLYIFEKRYKEAVGWPFTVFSLVFISLAVTSISLTRKLQFFIECHRMMIYFTWCLNTGVLLEILKGTRLFFDTYNLKPILATDGKPRPYRRKTTNPIIGREQVGFIQYHQTPSKTVTHVRKMCHLRINGTCAVYQSYWLSLSEKAVLGRRGGTIGKRKTISVSLRSMSAPCSVMS